MRCASSPVGISAIIKFLAPLLVTSELSAAAAARPRTFGNAIPNHPFTDAEVDLFNHSLPPTSTVGMVTHFWSTAVEEFQGGVDSGVTTYRYYIDGEAEASVVFTPREAAGVVFDPVGECADPECKHPAPMSGYDFPEPSGLDLVSAKVPWGTEWVGKTSDMDGWFTNLRVPFYKSLRVTAQLPPGHKPLTVYTIIRGQENVPLTIGGVRLSAEKPKLRTYHNKKLTKGSLEFTAIVNKTRGAGVIWGHTLGVQGHAQFYYLEGCFHLLTPWVAPTITSSPEHRLGLSANFPGVTLSTGVEDYYDSSFYFHAGIFQLPVSGVTHMCAGGKAAPPHPACPNSTQSQWSAYRFHEKDPLWFEDGVQLLVRNGDFTGPVPYGAAKCYNLNMTCGGFPPCPGPSVVTSTAFVYEFAD